jgi:signal transduction histidine kinase
MSSGLFNSRPLRRLSVRLTLWHSMIVLGSSLALLGITYALLRNRANATERDALEFRINQYIGEYRANGMAGVARLAALRKGRAQKAFFVRVGDSENETVFMRDPDDWLEFNPEQLARRPLPKSGEREWDVLHSTAGVELLLVSERLPDGGFIQVGKSNEDLREVLANFRRSAWWIMLIFVPASFAGGAFLASRALRPVQHLTGAAQEIIATSRFDARVPSPASGDELDALVRVFNEMLGRIDVLVRDMRESIDNVAHDLRTPLMRLSQKAQSLIEANQQQAAISRCPNCAAAVEALGDCVEEADRVTTMLNTLMDIAETEAGLVKLNPTPLPVASLVTRAVEAYTEFAEERGVSVSTRVPANLHVQGDSTAISRVVANLLDNAIKYTPAGGKVEISAERTDGQVEIRITDTGTGISPDDLPRIWQRLFRADRSRSQRGLGLGLSFVRAIVQAHGGTAIAESRVGVGTTIKVTLPVEGKGSGVSVAVQA